MLERTLSCKWYNLCSKVTSRCWFFFLIAISTIAIEGCNCLGFGNPDPDSQFHIGESVDSILIWTDSSDGDIVVKLETTRDANMFCYLEDPSQVLKRIFPNRFQPDPFVMKHARLTVPPHRRVAELQPFSRQGRYRVLCFQVSDGDMRNLALPFQVDDFRRIHGATIDTVPDSFMKAGFNILSKAGLRFLVE